MLKLRQNSLLPVLEEYVWHLPVINYNQLSDLTISLPYYIGLRTSVYLLLHTLSAFLDFLSVIRLDLQYENRLLAVF